MSLIWRDDVAIPMGVAIQMTQMDIDIPMGFALLMTDDVAAARISRVRCCKGGILTVSYQVRDKDNTQTDCVSVSFGPHQETYPFLAVA